MQPLRSLSVVLAVIVGALTVVAVTPAAPAAAAESFLLTSDDTTVRPSGDFSQCTRTVPEPNPQFRYLRRIHLADFGVPAGPFVLEQVSFGVAKVFRHGFADLRVFSIPTDDRTMTRADLTLLSQHHPIVASVDEGSVVETAVGLALDNAAAQDLVLSVGGGAPWEADFAIGGSYRLEKAESYILAPYCGFTDITDTDVFDIRSDPVIFGSGSTVDVRETSGEPTRTPADLDGDGFPNADDACPQAYAWGLVKEGYEGCSLIEVGASALYSAGSISGFVDPRGRYDPTPWQPTPEDQYEDLCQRPSTVTVWRFEGRTPTVNLGEATSGADGSYSVAVGPLPLGTSYGAVVTPAGVVDEKVYCDSRVFRDDIRTVAEPVERAVEAAFHVGRVTGRVWVPSPPAGAPTACQTGKSFDDNDLIKPAFVWLYARGADGDVEVDGTFVEEDGSFTLTVDPALPDGTELFVRTPYLDDEPHGGWCLPADSPMMTTIVDGDDDQVPDSRDRCPAATGPDGGSYPGCPTLPQVVSARADATTLSGTVTATGAVDGACSQTAVHIDGAGAPIPVTNLTRSGDVRSFSVNVSQVPQGSKIRVRADAAVDEGKAVCSSGESSLVTVGDDDGDEVFNANDNCRKVPGPATSSQPGCPYVQLQVLAEYAGGVVSGQVSAQRPAGATTDACKGPVGVILYQLTQNGLEFVDGITTADDGTFWFEVGAQDDGVKFQLSTIGYFHTGLAVCGAGNSEVVEVLMDADGDGVRDVVDQCDHLDGDGGLTEGCPVLQRAVTASYADGAVSGRVSFESGDDVSSACGREEHTVVLVYEVAEDGGDLDLLGVGRYSPVDGSYAVDLDRDLPLGAGYRVIIDGAVDPDVGWCGLADSGKRTVGPVDSDGDGVVDSDDECDGVPGQGGRFPSGCPHLQQQVTVGYAGGVVLGVVSVQRPGSAPDDACSGPATVRVWRVTAAGRELVDVVETTVDAADNLSYELPVGVADDGARFQAGVFGYLDTGTALCLEGQSGVAEVYVDSDGDEVRDGADACPAFAGSPDDPDEVGCPRLKRTMSAAYADATITGQVAVPGPHPAPAGSCLSTPVTAYTVVDGVPVQVGETTGTTVNGSYAIAVPGGLAAGTTYFTTTDHSVLETIAVCGAAESTRHLVPEPDPEPGPDPGPDPGPGPVVDPVPDPVIAPPGSPPASPPASPAAPVISGVKLTKKTIHVVGSRANPRATRLKLRLNVPATLVVKLKGPSSTAGAQVIGKKVIARLSATLPAGASAIKLTGKVGKKKLPPGKYRVYLRAANAVGAASAEAGRLRVKP